MPMNSNCAEARRAETAPSRHSVERTRARSDWSPWSLVWRIVATLIVVGASHSRAATNEDHCVADGSQTGMPPIVLQAVARDVWRVAVDTGEASRGNGGWVTQSVVVVDGARVWLIGSGPTPAQGLRLRCAISSTLHRAVTDVINTRAHPELALANLAFAGARLWALDDVANAMQQRCPQCLDRLQQRLSEHEDDASGKPSGAHDPAMSLHPITIRVPDHRLPGDTGALGPFRWWAIERAAGERTLLLLHRRSGWLIAQGLVWTGGVPNLRETSLDEMTTSLERLRSIAAQPDVTGLIGEQGEPGSATVVADHLEYLSQLRQRTQQALDRGEVEGARPIELPAFADRPGYAAYHALNRQRVWRALERRLFE